MKKFLFVLATAMMLSSCCGSLSEMTQTVTIDGSKGKLEGDLYRPAVRGSKAPVTIICHGLTGWRSEMHLTTVRDSLLARGIACVMFDFNGHGASEGRFSEMTVQNELDDLHCIYDYVASLPWVDNKRIAVAGHSQGGFITGVFAGDMGVKKVKCAVLMAPAACIHTQAKSNTMFGISTDPAVMPDSIPFWKGLYLGKQYIIVAKEVDVYERSAAYDGPAAIIQGTADDPWLFRDAKAMKDVMKDVEYFELEGLSHCYPEDYYTPAHLAAEFISKHI